MRVFLDECVPDALRKHLLHHETVTASYAGFAGLKNGALLRAVTGSGFQVLVTGDKNIEYEQNLTQLPIAVVALSANAWRLIAPNVSRIVAVVDGAVPGSVQRADCGMFRRRSQRAPGT